MSAQSRHSICIPLTAPTEPHPPLARYPLRINPRGHILMLKWALIFLAISVVSGILGFSGISAATATIAKVLFGLFLILFIIFLVLAFTVAGAVL